MHVLRLTPNRLRWVMFAILVMAYIMAFFQRMALAAVATDVMNDLQTKEAMMGVLSAAYFYPHALMQMPAGMLADKWGAKRTIGTFFIIAAFGSVLFGMAESMLAAALGRFLVGAGMAMLFVPAMKLFSLWFQGKDFALVTGLFISSGGLGALLATTPLAVVTEWLGWRASFVYAGIFTLVIATLAFVLIVEKPPAPTAAKAPAPNELQAGTVWHSLRFLLKQPAFWPLAAWFFFGNGLFFTFAGLWGGPYLEEIHHLRKADAGGVLAMVAVGIMLGGILLSALSNRVFGARRKPLMTFGALLILLLFATLQVFGTSLPLPALYAVYLLLGIFGNGIVAIGFILTKESFPLQLSGTALGLVNVFAWLGVAILQAATGLLLQGNGSESLQQRYTQLFIALLILSGITLIASILVRESGAYRLGDGQRGGTAARPVRQAN